MTTFTDEPTTNPESEPTTNPPELSQNPPAPADAARSREARLAELERRLEEAYERIAAGSEMVRQATRNLG